MLVRVNPRSRQLLVPPVWLTSIARHRELPGVPELVPPVPRSSDPTLVVDKDPRCCAARSRRRIQGGTVFMVVTHGVGCPVWSAR